MLRDRLLLYSMGTLVALCGGLAAVLRFADLEPDGFSLPAVMLRSGNSRPGNVASTAIYLTLPVTTVMWPAIIAFRLFGQPHDAGWFSYAHARRDALRRMLVSRAAFGAIATLLGSIAAALVVVGIAAIGKPWEMLTLFEARPVARATTNDVIRAAFSTVVVVATANFAIAAVLSLLTRSAVAVGAVLSTFIMSSSLAGVPILNSLVRCLPIFYADGWLARVSDGFVIDDRQHGNLISLLWLAVASIVLLAGFERPPRLGDIG